MPEFSYEFNQTLGRSKEPNGDGRIGLETGKEVDGGVSIKAATEAVDSFSSSDRSGQRSMAGTKKMLR